MKPARWMGAAIAALCLAVVPGAMQLLAGASATERAETQILTDSFWDVRAASRAEPDPAPTTTVTATTPEVAITPPTEALTGAVAVAPAAPRPFEGVRAASPGDVLALVVGIDDYPGRRYDLDSAVADADTIDRALAHFGVPAANRVVLRDGQARGEELVAAVQQLASRARPGTTVVVAYAGHVQKLDRNTEAIVAADGDLLTDRELARLLAPAQADRMWFLIASCYAGGFTELLAPGRVLTGAADANSIAYENPDLHGSYLVHYLVQEGWLEGRAGSSVQEAFAYADRVLAQSHPDRRPIQIDELGTPLRFGSTSKAAAPAPTGGSSGSTASSPPPTTTTTQPTEQCTLLVVCHRG